jgi:hypothetical protein
MGDVSGCPQTTTDHVTGRLTLITDNGFSWQPEASLRAGERDGRARLELDAAERHLNPAGTVHGGVLATLVDTAMGGAVRSTTDGSEIPATSQLSVVYLRPGSPGRLLVSAEVRKKG